MKKRFILYFLPLLAAGILLPAGCAKNDKTRLKSAVIPLENSPLIALRITFHFGSAFDPAGKEGLCRLTMNMLTDGGSAGFSAKEIKRRFFPMATGVGYSVDKEMSSITAQIHRDNLDAFYAVFKDMVLNPGFREEDFIRLKSDQLNYLEKTLTGNSDEQFGKEILNLMIYENHPYGLSLIHI